MIEFQYFEDCPNAAISYENLLQAVKELRISETEILRIEVPDADSAEKSNFQGSPSILIEGIDIYTNSKPENYNYSCRVYLFDNKQTGVIPKDFIKKKIVLLRSAGI